MTHTKTYYVTRSIVRALVGFTFWALVIFAGMWQW